MLVNILENIEASKTWLGAYASVYNSYTQYNLALADLVGNCLEFRAQLASHKTYDEEYAKIMEQSVTERAKIAIQSTKAQGDLVRSRVNFCVNLMAAIEPKLINVNIPLHDYDMMVLLDHQLQNTESSGLVSTYINDTSDLMIRSKDAPKLLFQEVLESKRELPELPFKVGQDYPTA